MVKKIVFILIVLGGGVFCAAGPYPPAAGQDGSTAIPMPSDPNDTSVFPGWADGWTDYIIGTEVAAEWQTPEKALGIAKGTMADHDIVCLGRGGQITLTFSTPIANGPGWDFATFENGTNDTFLELGYVEVSSDGINFFRFNNDSQTINPVGAFGMVDPTNISGYCSKYRQGFGTPFNLDELSGISGLDINTVTHVRILDIVGDGTYTDTAGNPVYDPYATVGSAGVDLD
ncbi:MAG: PEP-CTERM sorting domain-containing protein, partial [Planctomycetota bacterium]